jgi:hypothetical protein
VPRRFEPKDVLPPRVSRALGKDPYWFVIGGHAVRCFCPYRPSDDVDFGVSRPKDLTELLRGLEAKGKVKLLERSADTVHLSFEGTDVSIFVLPVLRAHTEGHALTATGILATKLHAILDRGTRRDFFDLYVMMSQERLGFVDCVRALREVYATDVNEGLLLRAVTYFDDANAEAPLAGEGKKDWAVVQTFFKRAAGALLTPPGTSLEIERRVVGVVKGAASARGRSRRT